MATQNGTTWHLKGSIIGACNCDWGCPCNFGAPPTYGNCNGAYVWQIREGQFGDVSLDGLCMGWVGESPGAMHLGHGTAQKIIDEQADVSQRVALLDLLSGNFGGPFEILASVTETELDPIIAPFETVVDGLSSRVSVPQVLELGLVSIKNPVTGEPEELKLVKGTGFTSTDTELGSTTVYRFTGGFSHEHSGKYGEFAEFEYQGD
ncbi:MAG: hypothetical protein BZY81_06715 [SAR202 cluster bacterium Io17-Chloro-G4]|nr:MAG: hypothetical protein BZY81_06715 [SAR202 cluster bacterium Io17-Chloro-G4]